ncbi:hypothetical protein MBLNU230_g5318t1 [Neophaeotheca triangularis]
MADDSSLPSDDSKMQKPTETSQESTTDAFAAHWQPTDTHSLLPGNLPLTRPARAYERKPSSPFTRRQVRVGKVWKRAAALPATRRESVASPGAGGGLAGKSMRRLKGQEESRQSPLKPVKKICLPAGSGGERGVRPQVALWEGRGSGGEGRKIVTRSGRRAAVAGDGEEGLVELAEEGTEGGLVDEIEGAHGAEEEDAEGTLVEVLDEDGMPMEGGGFAGDGEGWLDVEAEELGDDPEIERTLVQPDDGSGFSEVHDSVVSSQGEASDKQKAEDAEQGQGSTAVDEIATENAITSPNERKATEDTTPIHAQNTALDSPSAHLTRDDAPLPEGFVSPVKRAPRTSRRTVKEALAARRRTLPVQFAPAIVPEQLAADASHTDLPMETIDQSVEQHDSSSLQVLTPTKDASQLADKDGQGDLPSARSASMTTSPAFRPQTGEMVQPLSAEEAWEDVSEDEEQVETTENLPEDEPSLETLPVGAKNLLSEAEHDSTEHIDMFQDGDDLSQTASSKTITVTPTTLDTPTDDMAVESQSPFHVRKSPRRKSSSPIKSQHAVLKGKDVPHLVAFSPIKRVEVHLSTHDIPDLALPEAPTMSKDTAIALDDASPELASPVQRSSSAPPEEPKMSPHRPNKPRVSDDTALLQAFLSRAAANKSTKRATTARRESASNRRDSETVKQALASPAKPEVLGDLDPNSSSPRKPAGLEDMPNSEPIEEVYKPFSSGQDEGTNIEQAPKKRRSTRDKKKPAQNPISDNSSHPSPPNRIAVRGRADPIVLKKTEAHQLALTTKNNTRKNKGTSVLPQLRLTKLTTEVPPEAQNVPETSEQPATGKRGIRWDETLTYFFEAPSQPALLELGNSDSAPQLQAESIPMDTTEEDHEPQPPPPAETPSKPKVRRLKAPKATAASTAAGKTATAQPTAPAPPPPTTETPLTRKQRSRIATPAAKASTNNISPEAPIDANSNTPAPSTTNSTAPSSSLPRKRPAPQPSKLPSLVPSNSSLLGQGKGSLPAPNISTSGNGNGKGNGNGNGNGGPLEGCGAGLIASPAKKRRTAAGTTAGTGSRAKSGLTGPKFGGAGAGAEAEFGNDGLGSGPATGLASPAKKFRSKIGGFSASSAGALPEDAGAAAAAAAAAGGGEGRGTRSAALSSSGVGVGLSSPAKRRRR